MQRIIANKKIEVTDDEWRLYQKICNGYPQGKKIFLDLFETNEEGLIVILKPPQKEFTMEAVIYLQNLMLHQHLRKIYNEHDKALKELSDLKDQITKELKNINKSK